jgi:hypothetical protein
MVQNNQKIFFMLFLAIWAHQNRPKKEHKGPQVGEMYGPMSGLEFRPLTKSLGSFFLDKWFKTTNIVLFRIVFGHPKWTKKAAQKPASGQDVWSNV